MELVDFPVEVLILIIQRLDLVSLENLYNTCRTLRNIVGMHGVVKHGNMSCNVLATANTFKLKFFKDISSNLTSLNMSAVPDLTKTAFMPVLSKLKNLKILDISYTNLNILDLLVIQKKCPTIKDISINYTFGKSVTVPKEILRECQSLFENYENIHFVGSVNSLLYSALGLYLLAKVKLDNLKYTVAYCNSLNYIIDKEFVEYFRIPTFNHFAISLMNWNYRKPIPGTLGISWNVFPFLHTVDLQRYEYIVILVKEFQPTVYASLIFHNFFKDNFDVNAECIEQRDLKIHGNVICMIWDPETTNFGVEFFDDLLKRVKQYFPYCFIMKGFDENPAPSKYDWFYTMPVPFQCLRKSRYMSRQRRAPPNFILQYDTVFTEKNRVELSLDFKIPSNNAIALPDSSQYLSKLTYLSLIGFGRYTTDFFNILFRSCHNLVTLNVQSLAVAPCATTISRTLPLTKTLKNFRFVEKRIDFKALFASFSKCGTLENIYIVDESEKETNDIANPRVVFAKCPNLCSFFIEANMTETTKTKILQLFNKAKTICKKPHVHVTLQQLIETNQYSYDPYIEVFKLNPIKPT